MYATEFAGIEAHLFMNLFLISVGTNAFPITCLIISGIKFRRIVKIRIGSIF